MTTIHSAGFILLEQLFYHPNLAHSDNCLFLNGVKKKRERRREKNTIRETVMPVKKWKD
jgi:hypothetical protein